MTRRDKFAHALLKPINTAAVVLLGIYTVVWGSWLANPFWSVFGRAQLFSTLGMVAPEVFWGCLAIACGLVTIYGAYRRSYPALTFGSAVAGWHWFMISIFYFLGDWQNTGGITALVFAVYAAFIWLNIRVNYRQNPSQFHDESLSNQ